MEVDALSKEEKSKFGMDESVIAIDSGSGNIAQGHQWLGTESLYWTRVTDADSFRSSQTHDGVNTRNQTHR